MKDYEIIIDEKATKLESVWSAFGPHSQRFVRRSCLFWQLEPNQSKMLLVFELIHKKTKEFFDLILLNKKTKDKDLLLAKELFMKVKNPDWKIKKEILEKKKKELEKQLEKEIKYIKEKVKIWTNYKLKPIKIYLVYAPEPLGKGSGGCAIPSSEPNISLRIGKNSEIHLALIVHEMLHASIKDTKEKKKMQQIDDAVEEAIFDLFCIRVDKDQKRNISWEEAIKEQINNRDGLHKKYIHELYKMLKPILHGKDDCIWKYIDWKKLERIKVKG